VGVWAGNFDGRAVINKTGSIVPTQIVSDVINRLSEEHPLPPAARDFKPPARVVAARICTVTGLGATPSCDSTRTEYFRSAAEVPPPCAWHANPSGRRELLLDSLLAGGETVRILFPVNGQVMYLDETLRAGSQAIPVSIAARDAREVQVMIDGKRASPGTGLSGLLVSLTRGSHQIIAASPSGRDRVRFEVR
jgi:hypothetical protein